MNFNVLLVQNFRKSIFVSLLLSGGCKPVTKTNSAPNPQETVERYQQIRGQDLRTDQDHLNVASTSLPARYHAKFESVIQTKNGLFAKGYAVSKSNPSSQLSVNLYRGAPQDAGGTLIASSKINVNRSDIAKSLKLKRTNIGFEVKLPSGLAGQKIYAHISPAEAGVSSLIPASSSSDGGIAAPSPAGGPPPNPKPTPQAASVNLSGVLERITTDGEDQKIVGWARSTAQGQQIQIHVYADADGANPEAFVGSTLANLPRQDLSTPNTFGFTWPLPKNLLISGRTIYVYALGTTGQPPKLLNPGGTLIPMDINLLKKIQPTRVTTWSPQMASGCSIRALSSAPWIDQKFAQDCGSTTPPPAWLISTTLENDGFAPSKPNRAMNGIPSEDPMFKTSATLNPDTNRYIMNLRLDKTPRIDLEGFNVIPHHLFAAMLDSYDLNLPSKDHPNLGDNFFVEFSYRMKDWRATVDNDYKNPRLRFTTGVTFRFENTGPAGDRSSEIGFTEVNIKRTDNFDLCPQGKPCTHGLPVPQETTTGNGDPDGTIDHRNAWGYSAGGTGSCQFGTQCSGEQVYFNLSSLTTVIQQPSADGWIFVRLPITYLTAKYPWMRKPKRWANTDVAGVYLGFEGWGVTVGDVEIKDYQSFVLK